MEDKKMTKFYEEMQKINISNDEVSKINEIYLKLLNKAFELNIDFSKILAEDEVIDIAKKVKEGKEINEAFKEVLNKSSVAKEVKVSLKELL
jgi:hypothetical protein